MMKVYIMEIQFVSHSRLAIATQMRFRLVHAMQIIFSGTIMAPSRRFPFEREQNGDHRQPCRA